MGSKGELERGASLRWWIRLRRLSLFLKEWGRERDQDSRLRKKQLAIGVNDEEINYSDGYGYGNVFGSIFIC